MYLYSYTISSIMKTIQDLLILALFSSIRLFPQDTLYTKSGEVIQAKVVEIGTEQVKYKKASNADGPLYVINKTDIALIHYKNGAKDIFSSSNPGSDKTSSGNSSNSPTVINNNYSNQPYGRPRANVNVIVGGPPMMGFSPLGWYGPGFNYGFYRPYVYRPFFHGRRGRHW